MPLFSSPSLCPVTLFFTELGQCYMCVFFVPPLGKYVVFFFYPLDFTFVCPTEIIAFSDAAEEFRKIDCEVIGASVDSHFCHLAW